MNEGGNMPPFSERRVEMSYYMTHPIVPSILPTKFPLTAVSAELGIYILLLLAAVGMSVLVGWILTKVMQGKGLKCSLPVTLILSGTLSLLAVLRFGFTLTTVQGILLSFVLLYASCSDLTDHTMDDFLWVMVAMLGLCSIGTAGLPSMLIGAVMVFVPQMLSALLCKNPIGGADIKLTTALAFLLGWQKGLAVLIVGMLLAVITMLVAQKVKKSKKKQPFALIPFLSVAAMAIFLV